MVRSALVSPGADLTAAELDRYARQITLLPIGIAGQRRLKASRVLVLGAGGLGAPTLTALVAAGVGTIGVVDNDTVAASNLHRQTLFGLADIGRPKVEVAAERLALLNPLVRVVQHNITVSAATVLALVADYDVIVDGTDNFETRYLAHDAAAVLGKPYVWGSVLRLDGQVTVFWKSPPDGDGVAIGDLFPGERDNSATDSCATAGVLGPVCGIIGSAMAMETIKLLVGFGELLLGRMLVIDGLDATVREIRFGAPDRSHATHAVETAQQQRSPEQHSSQGGKPTQSAKSVDHHQESTGTMTTPTDNNSADRTPPENRSNSGTASSRQVGSAASQDSPRVTAAQLAELLAARERGDANFVLVDVREPWEREIVSIDGSAAIPMAHLLTEEALEIMPHDDHVVLYCHHGSRSAAAQQYLSENGWSNIQDLEGGVDSWVSVIEPSKAHY